MGKEETPKHDEALEMLVKQIKTSHHKYLGAMKSALLHARDAGNLLLQAQKKVHGSGELWEIWVRDNCKFSKQTAERYMRLARGYPKLEELGPKVQAGLTLTRALRLLSDKSKGQDGPAAKGRPNKAPTQKGAKKVTPKADRVRFPDGSPEKALVDMQVEIMARQILDLARKAKPKDEQGQPIEFAQVAAAILELLQGALDASLATSKGPESQKPEVPPVTPAEQSHTCNGLTPALAG